MTRVPRLIRPRRDASPGVERRRHPARSAPAPDRTAGPVARCAPRLARPASASPVAAPHGPPRLDRPRRRSSSPRPCCGRSPGSSRSRPRRSSAPRSRSSACCALLVAVVRRAPVAGRDRPGRRRRGRPGRPGVERPRARRRRSRPPRRHSPTRPRSTSRTKAHSTRPSRPIGSSGASAATPWRPCAVTPGLFKPRFSRSPAFASLAAAALLVPVAPRAEPPGPGDRPAARRARGRRPPGRSPRRAGRGPRVEGRRGRGPADASSPRSSASWPASCASEAGRARREPAPARRRRKRGPLPHRSLDGAARVRDDVAGAFAVAGREREPGGEPRRRSREDAARTSKSSATSSTS